MNLHEFKDRISTKMPSPYLLELITVGVVGVLLLTGCQPEAVRPAPHILEQSKMVVMDIPPELLIQRKSIRPPEVKYYMSLSKDAREDAIIRLLLKANTEILNCNAEKGTISDLIMKQKATAEEFNRSEAARIKKLQESLNKE